jgi:hypothetical protein
MDIEVIRRICLARHLYELGIAGLKSANDLYLFSAVNLLQDAVEAFLLAVADFVGAPLDERTHFDKYFVLINERIAPKELPFKSRLLRLNRIRIDSKHHGIQPARGECERLGIAVREFFDEVSNSVLNVNFTTVSAIDLLMEGKTKDVLLDAKFALDSKDLQRCAISCRKAIYLELERQYYDHSHLDQELLKFGIDNTAFWNIWRLTPEVYRTKDDEWAVKYDFAKLEPEILTESIEYIFNTTIDIVLAIHAKKGSIKTSAVRRYYLELIQEEVPLYEKADSTSRIITTSPKGLTKLDCDYHVMGLQGDGSYWHVHDREHGLRGFIHNDYVKVEN